LRLPLLYDVRVEQPTPLNMLQILHLPPRYRSGTAQLKRIPLYLCSASQGRQELAAPRNRPTVELPAARFGSSATNSTVALNKSQQDRSKRAFFPASIILTAVWRALH
jgi:hypothetical protein